MKFLIYCLFVFWPLHCCSADSVQNEIDTLRREFHRLDDKVDAIRLALLQTTDEAEKINLNKQRLLRLEEMERINKQLTYLSSEQNVKRHKSSFTTTIPIEHAHESVLWKYDVMEKKIPREIVDIDELLQPARSLVCELRWLLLKLTCMSKSKRNLEAVKQMRRQREKEKNQRDLELPYHPLLLLFYQSAAAGQAGLEFLSEDHSADKPREDIRGMINGKRCVPQECKVEVVYNPDTADQKGQAAIDANSEPLGKLLQVSGL